MLSSVLAGNSWKTLDELAGATASTVSDWVFGVAWNGAEVVLGQLGGDTAFDRRRPAAFLMF